MCSRRKCRAAGGGDNSGWFGAGGGTHAIMETWFDAVNRLATKSRKQKAEKLKSFKAEIVKAEILKRLKAKIGKWKNGNRRQPTKTFS